MKKNNIRILVACAAILAIILACTLPITITVPTTQEQPHVEIPPIVAAPTAVPTAVPPTLVPPTVVPPAATAVMVAPVNWSGAWVMWMGSALQQYNIDFVIRNNQLSGNAAIGGGNSIGFYGLVSADNRIVTGNWESTDGTSGTFTFRILDTYTQFNGNKGGVEQVCGARSGIARPASCLTQ